MDYSSISSFLDKFKNTLLKKEDSYRIIIEIINKHTKILIDQKNIKIKGSLINIKTSPILKSEILINKESIIKDLSQQSPNLKFTDIN